MANENDQVLFYYSVPSSPNMYFAFKSNIPAELDIAQLREQLIEKLEPRYNLKSPPNTVGIGALPYHLEFAPTEAATIQADTESALRGIVVDNLQQQEAIPVQKVIVEGDDYHAAAELLEQNPGQLLQTKTLLEIRENELREAQEAMNRAAERAAAREAASSSTNTPLLDGMKSVRARARELEARRSGSPALSPSEEPARGRIRRRSFTGALELEDRLLPAGAFERRRSLGPDQASERVRGRPQERRDAATAEAEAQARRNAANAEAARQVQFPPPPPPLTAQQQTQADAAAQAGRRLASDADAERRSAALRPSDSSPVGSTTAPASTGAATIGTTSTPAASASVENSGRLGASFNLAKELQQHLPNDLFTLDSQEKTLSGYLTEKTRTITVHKEGNKILFDEAPNDEEIAQLINALKALAQRLRQNGTLKSGERLKLKYCTGTSEFQSRLKDLFEKNGAISAILDYDPARFRVIKPEGNSAANTKQREQQEDNSDQVGHVQGMGRAGG